MIINKKIDVKISGRNIKTYEEITNKNLQKGDTIRISQLSLKNGCTLQVECECDSCGKFFSRKRADIRSETTLCGKACRTKFFKKNNPNPSVEKIPVECEVCKEKIEVFPSVYKKQENFLCSRECYAKHRSIEYNGDNTYNFQDDYVPCDQCKKEIKTSKWYTENKKHQFCTQECYWMHRKENYKEFYYSSNLNNHRKETQPELKVREWLETNNIKYKQECGFLKKYFVDFYLPDYKAIIEVFGDYWHVNPLYYDVQGNDNSKKPLNDYQRKFVDSEYDAKRNAELESYGYPVYVIWEKDTKENLDEEMSILLKKLK